MRDINNVVKSCCEKLDVIGIKYGTIVSITINTRAKKRWGQCKKIGNCFAIQVSSRLISEDVELVHLETTVIHEILHTCKGCMNHGNEWKTLAEKVNRAYGYNIKRTTSNEEKGIEPIPAKYKFVCKDCGCVVTRMRESDFVKHYYNYRCAKCHGDFKRII